MIKFELFSFTAFDKAIESMQLYQKKKSELMKELALSSGKLSKASPVETDRMYSLLLNLTEELGLSATGVATSNMQRIEHISKNYAKHSFKVGTILDTETTMGLNKVLVSNKLPSINTIFDGKRIKIDDITYISVNWPVAFDFIVDSITGLKKSCYPVNNVLYCDTCIRVRPTDVGVETAGDAVEWTKKSNNSKISLSRFGYHFGDYPMRVKSIVSGNDGSMYMVCMLPANWYLEALDIIKETIVTVLSYRSTNTYVIRKSNEK